MNQAESETCPNAADDSVYFDSVTADDGSNCDLLPTSSASNSIGDISKENQQQKKAAKSGNKKRNRNQKNSTSDREATIEIVNESKTEMKAKVSNSNVSNDDRIQDILLSSESTTLDQTVDQILSESIESAVTNSSFGNSDCPFGGSITSSTGSGFTSSPGTDDTSSKGRRSSSLSSQPVTDHPLKMTSEMKPPLEDTNNTKLLPESERRPSNLLPPKPRSLRGSIISSAENSRPASVNSNHSRKSLTGVDIDDPLPSGFGTVSKDCSEEDLEGWSEVLLEWKSTKDGVHCKRPSQLPDLVKKGIPEALRGQVWQLLANCHNYTPLLNQYNDLVSKKCKDEPYILRDVSRTYPAHDYFKDPTSLGQESLHRVCKAFANYDTEIGYCQGMSFVSAALLLHMPEEEAFCLLAHIMSDSPPENVSNGSNKNGNNNTIYGYGHRNLFKGGFDQLHLRFYQLDRLIQDNIPELSEHFSAIGIESHMYASQWFLTLFTAKFPLFASFYILDLYLLDGISTLFQVSLSLLELSKDDLLKADFEGVLRYFRVTLPKKFSTEQLAKLLLEQAVNTKVSTAALKKYEKSFSVDSYVNGQGNGGPGGIVIAGQELVKRFQLENKRLVYSNMRLEQENDDLARELVSSKIHLRKQLDSLEDVNDSLRKEVKSLISTKVDLEEDCKRLNDEVMLLKDNFRSEVDRTEKEITRNLKVINEYKSITSQLSQRLEKESDKSKELVGELINSVKDCSGCHKKLINVMKSFENVDNLNGKSTCSDGTSGETYSGDNNENGNDGGSKKKESSLDSKIRELELELAQTKLALVEAECVNQDLVHDLNDAQNQLKSSKGSNWINKTLTTIREVKAAASAKRSGSTTSVKDDHSSDGHFPGPRLDIGPPGLSSSRVQTPGTPNSSTSSSFTNSSRFLSRENSRDFS